MTYPNNLIITLVFLSALFSKGVEPFTLNKQPTPKDAPNILFLFCDDLGYGDVQILNPDRGKIKTPHLDSLARSGIIFTDAHSGSAVCTPTRYGLLTGRYSWRTTKQRGVASGFASNLIASDRPTVATFLQSYGYYTGLIGKWHMNFHYTDPTSGAILKRDDCPGKIPPVGSTIPDGPLMRGFDYFHGFHHAREMQCVMEAHTVIAHDEPINMLGRITKKSVAFIKERSRFDTPWFLYVPYGSPHTPILPTDAWKGKSGINAYADFVMENDDSIGQILTALEQTNQRDNTLIIFSSDNGCSKAANFKQLEKAGHFSSAHLRGSKADLWDGGHRVPFFASWHGHITPGTINDSTICLTDFFSTTVEILKAETPAKSCEDSVSFLPAFKNQPIPSTRQGIVHHSFSGHFGYRMGDWKLVLAKGSAGWTSPTTKEAKSLDLPPAQLYNLAKDISETNNLYPSMPEKAQELLNSLEKSVNQGRSTTGPESTNDLPNNEIILWKSGKPE